MIRDVLAPAVTSLEEIQAANSAANLAFEWLVGEDDLYLCPDDPKLIQRYVVGKIYFQQEGDTWLECSNPEYTSQNSVTCNPPSFGNPLNGNPWLDASHECDWAFITCNADLCITRIEVDDNNVGGTLVNEIDHLAELEVYTMDGYPNHISGTIPSQFGNLTALRIFDLDQNKLTGSIPIELYNAKKLQQLDLDSNKLTGSISTMIGTLSDIWFLQFFDNKLTGPIPEEVGNLKNLYTLSLHKNKLSGSIPAETCFLRENGQLLFLTTDCKGDNPEVKCDCCTRCE